MRSTRICNNIYTHIRIGGDKNFQSFSADVKPAYDLRRHPPPPRHITTSSPLYAIA